MAATDVCTLDQARQHLNWASTPTSDEAAELSRHISAASELVDQLVGPVVIRETVDYERGGPRIALDHRPVESLVSVAPSYGGVALDVAALRVSRDSGVVRRSTGGRLWGGPFDITYRAGRVAATVDVPASMSLACCVIVAHLWKTQRAVTMGPGMSSDEDFTAPVAAGYAIPYRARDLLAPWMQTVVV